MLVGLAVAVWRWTGSWPWAGPAVYSGSDFAAMDPAGLGITMPGVLAAVVGALLLFAGRGGPSIWGRP
jgi:hypothetical protein